MSSRWDKWDIRFLRLAREVSTWSKDPSTKAGAVLIRSDNTVISVGFNGFPRNMDDSPELYADREKKYSRVVHCEVNALIHAKESLNGATLYTYPFMCCDRCVVQMIQAGVERFVFTAAPPEQQERWKDIFDLTLSYIDESGRSYREFGLDSLDG